MKIIEIKRAVEMNTIGQRKAPVNKVFFREIDFQNVYVTKENTHTFIFFTVDSDDFITAFIAVTDQNEFIRMENISKKPGLVSIILYAFLSKFNELKINADEAVTYAGLKWITAAVARQKNIIITDTAGNEVSPSLITNDWFENEGKLGLVLRANTILNENIDENPRKYYSTVLKSKMNTSWIQPMTQWVGDEGLL